MGDKAQRWGGGGEGQKGEATIFNFKRKGSSGWKKLDAVLGSDGQDVLVR